jgi:RHS repeat-associated protein
MSKTFTLDPSRRLLQATDTTSSTETRRIVNHYADTGDSPAWIATSTDAGTNWTWERNVQGIDGDLAALQPSTGPAQIQLANLHGDVVATTDTSTATVGINTYFEQTEYGLPRATNTATPARYGWLGTEQRSNDALGGLTLMGVRLYNPTTGRFLQVDPVPGGNENAYNYPNDPINEFDLDGRWSFRKIKRAVANGAIKTFKMLAPGAIKAACASAAFAALVCTAISGGLVAVAMDLVRARILDGRWLSKKDVAISFAYGAAWAVGWKFIKKFGPTIVRAAGRALGAVARVLRKAGMGAIATTLGTYIAGGLTIAVGTIKRTNNPEHTGCGGKCR